MALLMTAGLDDMYAKNKCASRNMYMYNFRKKTNQNIKPRKYISNRIHVYMILYSRKPFNANKVVFVL